MECCSYCPSEFSTIKKLHSHIYYNHTDFDPPSKYFCDRCNVQYTKDNIKEHINNFHLYVCYSCHAVLYKSGYFQFHTEKCCSTNQCQKCELIFLTFEDLISHALMKHNIKKTYCCSKCMDTFKVQKLLEQHKAEDYSV